MQFQWHPDDPPPHIEEHSRAKLDVLRSYLRAYFDRLNVSPNREVFKLDLIDGFAGGGTFRDGDEIVSGTPLIMLEEIKAAESRLNRGRTKSLRFDCKCYFVDKEASHTDHLRKVLDDRGYRVDDESIAVRKGRFEDRIDAIIEEIKRRQPRVGRAIFLLDQTGFSQVALANVVPCNAQNVGKTAHVLMTPVLPDSMMSWKTYLALHDKTLVATYSMLRSSSPDLRRIACGRDHTDIRRRRPH